MNEANLVRDAARALEARLPAGWRQRLQAQTRAGSGRPDAILELTGPDGVKTRLVVEARTSLTPRAVADLRARVDSYASGAGVVVAPFLSRSTRERLRASALNYLDLTGNVRLVLSRPGLYVETQGAADDPSPAAKPGRSLRGAKAGRIVRALCDFPPPLAISDLATKAKVAISYASRLVEWLAGEAVVERVPRGPVLKVDRGALIRRWADDYQVLKSNEARSYLDPRGLDNLARRLAEGALAGRYALTGSLAASRLAPLAPARLAMLYVEDPDSASSVLDLRPAEAGTNVMLLVPFDEVVFERTWEDADLRFVAPSQVAVDLLTSPGRAPNEAEAVLANLVEKAP
jgi:hypothetical protein